MSTPDLCILYGSLRSGTTMLRLMLDHHPQLICPEESDFLTDHLRPRTDGGQGWTYDRDALVGDRIFRESRAGLPEADDARTAFREMAEHLREGADGCLILDMHRGLDRMLDLDPGARVLHLVRDPRDVARSAIGMGWAGNVYYGAETWLRTERTWDACRARLAPEQVHELHYEDLVRSPEATLRGICDFLGIDYDPAMLSYGENSTYEPPDVALVEQWRHKQSPRELGLVEPLFGPLLSARGYAPSGHPPITPNPAERCALWWQNKRGVWGKKIDRYGLADPLILAFGRRLGLDRVTRKAQRRIDDKAAAYLK